MPSETKLLPLAAEPFSPPTDRDMSPSEREKILSFLAEVIQTVRGWRASPYRNVQRHGKKNSRS